jgi:hypothetical protein
MVEPQQLCKRFCRICKEPFGGTVKVFLNDPKDTLSRCGKLLLSVTGIDITIEKHDSLSYACKLCFETLEQIEKRERSVAESKAIIGEKAKAAEQFFSAGKRSRIPVRSPAAVYTPTRSPAPKRQYRDISASLAADSQSRRSLFQPSSDVLATPLESTLTSAAQQAYTKKTEFRKEKALDYILTLLELESERLCSAEHPTAFRNSSAECLRNFSFDAMAEQLHQEAPTLFAIFRSIATPSGSYIRKTSEGQKRNAATVVAVSVLLKQRCIHVNTVAYILGLLLWQGNASNKTVERCNHMNICVGPTSLSKKLDELGKGFDAAVLDWATQGNQYQIVGDNVDIRVVPRHMTLDHRTADHHWFHIYAVKNRVQAPPSLCDDHPIGDIKTAQLSVFLPTKQDCCDLAKEFIAIIMRVLVQHVPKLQRYASLVPVHLPHKHSTEMMRKSEIVNLGVVMKNEQRTEEMIEILAALNKYLPQGSSRKPVPFCGDQLTAERCRSAQGCRVQSETAVDRLEGLIAVPADWHALVTFYKVR